MKSFAYWVFYSLSSYHHVWKLYLVREFELKHEDTHYRDENKSFKDKDKIIKDLDQN